MAESTDVFTGFEGIMTPDLLRQQRLLDAQKAAAVRAARGKPGAEFGAGEAGAFTGQALSGILRKAFPGTFDPEGQKARQAQEIITEARKKVAESSGEPGSLIDARIKSVKEARRMARARGLDTLADQLAANEMQLEVQARELRKLGFEEKKAELEVTQTELENEIKTEDARIKSGEVSGRDEFTRLQNRLDALDPTDPANASNIELIDKRLKKLTDVVGRTEFDEPGDKTLFRNSLDDLRVTSDSLSRLRGIQESFNPDFVSLQGRVKNFGVGIADSLKLPLPEETKKEFAEYKTFQMRTINNLNLYIKEITGAQMSIQEAERLTKGLPNREDGPTAFKQKLDESLAVAEASQERAEAVAMAAATGDFQSVREAQSIDVFARAQELLQAQEPAPIDPGVDAADVPVGDMTDEQLDAEARRLLGLPNANSN